MRAIIPANFCPKRTSSSFLFRKPAFHRGASFSPIAARSGDSLEELGSNQLAILAV